MITKIFLQVIGVAASSAMAATISTITAFAPDPTCSTPSLSLLLEQGNRVWINYPYPAPGLTSSACYPPDMLQSLATPFALPPTTSLSCPGWYSTITKYSDGYVACCPTSYTLALAPTGAPSSRPALSATCFSNLPNPTTVIAYDNVTVTATQAYNNPTAQAFALVIDGFVSTVPTQGVTRSTIDVAAATVTAEIPTQQPTISGSAIAGIAAGAGIGIFALVSAVVILSVRFRDRSGLGGRRKDLQELSSGPSVIMGRKSDEEGRYWRNVMVRTVTDKTLELPAEKMMSMVEDSGDRGRPTP